MAGLTTSNPREELPARTGFSGPTLRLPRFELVPVARPVEPATQSVATQLVALAPAPAPITPVPLAPIAPPPPPVQVVAAPPAALARMRRDAMLGLVVGIGAAVFAAALVLAMWASLHGDPPGLHG